RQTARHDRRQERHRNRARTVDREIAAEIGLPEDRNPELVAGVEQIDVVLAGNFALLKDAVLRTGREAHANGHQNACKPSLHRATFHADLSIRTVAPDRLIFWNHRGGQSVEKLRLTEASRRFHGFPLSL